MCASADAVAPAHRAEGGEQHSKASGIKPLQGTAGHVEGMHLHIRFRMRFFG